jgi:parvulin-like peptidyl-prolyl isomerase
MLQNYYADRTSEQIAKEFGPVFAQALVRTDAGSWQGPVESGFGWHLLFIDSRVPGRQPAFSEIESEVKTAWLGAQKASAWQQAYDEMRAKYTVVVPELPESSEVLQAVSESPVDQ